MWIFLFKKNVGFILPAHVLLCPPFNEINFGRQVFFYQLFDGLDCFAISFSFSLTGFRVEFIFLASDNGENFSSFHFSILANSASIIAVLINCRFWVENDSFGADDTDRRDVIIQVPSELRYAELID